ncbi:MAG: hypothetical protein HZY76_10235 [Anaerolineae bacterium]|nr:MAG: hypothetical protein HZY76_10235 [Anaerolineae bacterium]
MRFLYLNRRTRPLTLVGALLLAALLVGGCQATPTPAVPTTTTGSQRRRRPR